MRKLSLFYKKENCIEATIKLLSVLNVNVTASTVEKDLFDHPDYPSLLSISDALTSYGVENISIKSNIDKVGEMLVPCIVSIKSESDDRNLFSVIASVRGKSITYFHPEKYLWEDISKEDFEKKWPSGIVLLADAKDAPGEKDYNNKHREEKRLKATKYVTWFTLPVLAVFASLLDFAKYGSMAAFPTTFFLLTLLGCIISCLLLWYELDEYNPVLQQICSAGKKVNCGAILNSKASKIVGISWSVIGFTYFSGGLFVLLFIGIVNVHSLFVLAWLNVLALPYVCFSICYQWRIVKQWCLMCIYIQCLLVLQLFISLIAGWHTALRVNAIFSNELIMPIAFAYLIPFFTANLLLSVHRSAKESKTNKAELLRIKHNPQIFAALLEKQKALTESTAGLGIVLGNPDATHKLIKVCNPYCGPCAKAHQQLEELLRANSDLQIQIIFTATNNEEDIKGPPVRHLLAIAGNGKEKITRQALDDWYLTEKKDYNIFADKYPMNGELKRQDDKVDAMRAWCDSAQITFTPTFFVSLPFPDREENREKFHQLPEMYKVSDLKYFLSV